MSHKQTIFIPVNRAAIVRGLLLNNFTNLLKDKYRVVLLTDAFEDEEFCEKFNFLSIEPFLKRPLSNFKKKLEQIFISIHRALIYNETSEVFAGLGRGSSVGGELLKNGELVRYKYLRYFLAKYVFGKFLAYDKIRTFFKFVDRLVFPCGLYDDIIKKYNPSLVLITSIGCDDQIALLRNCKRCGVRSIGTTINWDNVSKWGFREKVDKLVLWSDFMKKEAIIFQQYEEKDVLVVGIPRFDCYASGDVVDRVEFLRRFGVDPIKKLILFGSEGPICPDDPYIVYFLKEKIRDGTLSGFQILVRPHFTYQEDVGRFLPYVDNEIVFMDRFSATSSFRDSTGLTLESAHNLKWEIRFCDVMIVSASTLILDGVANGKLPVLYNFDADKSKPFKESVKRLYGSQWFRAIFKFNMDNVANNEMELVKKIKDVSSNPEKDIEKRNMLIREFCFRIDGKSGERLFSIIDNFVENNCFDGKKDNNRL